MKELWGSRARIRTDPSWRRRRCRRPEREALARVALESGGADFLRAPKGWDDELYGGGVDAVAAKIHMLHGAPLWLSLVGIAVASYETAGVRRKAVVPKFLNRILGLEVSRQQKLFDYFARTLERMIRARSATGRTRKASRRVDGRSVEFERPAKATRLRRVASRSSATRSWPTSAWTSRLRRRMLEETRSAGKATAIDIDGGDDDDGGSTALVPKRDSDGEGWISTGRVTNVSNNNQGFVPPPAQPGERRPRRLPAHQGEVRQG